LAAKAGCGQIFGLSWPATIEPAGGGRVQVLQVDDDALEASTIAERLSEMRGLDADLAWMDCAVLARRHAALEPVRAVLEERGVPVSWTPERGSLPPLGRVREIAAFLRALEAVEKEARSASQLEARRQELAGDDAGNPWWRLVAEIVAEWRDELADATAPVDAAIEHVWEGRRRGVVAGGGARVGGTADGGRVDAGGGGRRASRGGLGGGVSVAVSVRAVGGAVGGGGRATTRASGMKAVRVYDEVSLGPTRLPEQAVAPGGNDEPSGKLTLVCW